MLMLRASPESSELGQRITKAASERLEVTHPENPLIGSRFDARIEGIARVGQYEAVTPSIEGRAWITSFNQLVLDPSDPFQEGFLVGRL